MAERLVCPHCGRALDRWDQPRLTVDAVVFNARDEVLLVERLRLPAGWALPGGFVDPGETLEQAVCRELREETSLEARRVTQFHTYSEPSRDPRHHTVTTVFLVEADGRPKGGDDAARAAFHAIDRLPPLAFDHAAVIADVVRFRATGARPGAGPPTAPLC